MSEENVLKLIYIRIKFYELGYHLFRLFNKSQIKINVKSSNDALFLSEILNIKYEF